MLTEYNVSAIFSRLRVLTSHPKLHWYFKELQWEYLVGKEREKDKTIEMTKKKVQIIYHCF